MLDRRTLLTYFAASSCVAGASPAFSQTSRPINGVWNSNYGQVTLNVDSSGAVTGYWTGDKGRGTITNGKYDGFAVVVFEYSQPWNNAKGRAALRLSADGHVLSGGWSEQTPDGKGMSPPPEQGWTVTRRAEKQNGEPVSSTRGWPFVVRAESARAQKLQRVGRNSEAHSCGGLRLRLIRPKHLLRLDPGGFDDRPPFFDLG